MKNKLLLPMFILLFCMTALLAGCGGGGTGGSNAPGNVNAGVPTVIKLLPVQFIAQTNSFITLKARVLDGNGNVVQNYPVSFTNMSLTGVLSAVTANTDSNGNAEVTIFSPTPGFATILVQVNTGHGMVRDNKTVYFTSASSLNLFPTMALDVEGNDSNSTYDDPADYNLFEVADDTQVTIRATVFNSVGLLVSGATVTFGSDFPYKIGSDPACSDGSTTCEVTFPLGNTATTDSFGQAYVLVQVTPTVLRNITTVLNITATANNGAFNIVSLFLNPVTVSTVSVTANPSTVASAGTSTITAAVTTSAGTPVPDGTTVTFTASAGGALDTPFAQTTDGIATAKLTAPTVTSNTSVSVTASVGGKSGSASVAVTAPTSAATCVANAPTISISPDAAEPVAAGASVNYAVTITNSDTGGTCASVTYALTKTDNPSLAIPNTDFASSALSATTPAVCALVPGVSCTAVLTVTATAAAPPTPNPTLSTLLTVSATGHANGTATVTTTKVP